MKLKLIYLLSVMVIMLIITGCKISFLDEKVYRNIAATNFWKSAGGAQSG